MDEDCCMEGDCDCNCIGEGCFEGTSDCCIYNCLFTKKEETVTPSYSCLSWLTSLVKK